MHLVYTLNFDNFFTTLLIRVMERYFKRKNVGSEPSFVREVNNDDIRMDHSKQNRVKFNIDELPINLS